MSDIKSNPLCTKTYTIPFAQIKATQIEPAIAHLLQEAQAQVELLISNKVPRSFENTVVALEKATENLGFAFGIVAHLESVATYPEQRTAFNAVQGPVSDFYSSLMLSEPLWQAIQAYAQTAEAKSLTGIKKRLLERTVSQFTREGALLQGAAKERLRTINRELAEATNTFSQHVIDAMKEYELYVEDEKLLAGLPERAKNGASESAKSKGKTGWRFTLQEPSYVAVMTYLDERSIREKMWRAYTSLASTGTFDTTPLINTILALRHEKAVLLGYKDFAEYVLEQRMAKNGDKVRSFLSELETKVFPFAKREHEELLAFSKESAHSLGSEATLEPWDVPYFAEKQRQIKYNFDQEETRPYFSVESVLQGVFDLSYNLFGITVEPTTDLESWDKAVRCYKMHDSDGTFLGYFYVDLFPRENKRPGAWMNALLLGEPQAGAHAIPHVGLFAGNFTPASEGTPALLTHSEVETVFHEFGHLLHHMLTEIPYRTLGGTSVEWDFVELPSQILENWCWEPEVLAKFAKHYKTGAALPEELLQRMLNAKNYRTGSFFVRQLSFSSLDIALHTQFAPTIDPKQPQKNERAVLTFTRELLQRFIFSKLPNEYTMVTSFGHLFSDSVGYAAGYYSYKWAEVLEADAFTRFSKEGVLNKKVGIEFRKKILARGDAEPPEELFRSFMGRDPSSEPLLERSGLV